MRLTTLVVLGVSAMVGVAVFAGPAAGGTVVKSVIHVHETDIDSGVCAST